MLTINNQKINWVDRQGRTFHQGENGKYWMAIGYVQYPASDANRLAYESRREFKYNISVVADFGLTLTDVSNSKTYYDIGTIEEAKLKAITLWRLECRTKHLKEINKLTI